MALVWMALDVAIYSALLAAWYYKWYSDRPEVRRRPRPVEYDYRVSVLFNRQVNATQAGDGDRRLMPDPSPGTPRHPAYPSGHSTYAGAGSEILSYFFPDDTAEFDKLADNAGMARLWAGIHWRSDHEQGMRLGRCVARQIIDQLQSGRICPPDVCSMPKPCRKPPTYEQLEACANKLEDCCRNEESCEEPCHPLYGDEEDYGHSSQEQGEAVSSGALREQARSSQEGAEPTGSPGAEREQAKGPQEGAASGASGEVAQEQAEGPQEGAK